jgi:drug/metabolite transporter (DMT)-like permease
MTSRERIGALLILLSVLGYALFPVFTANIFASGLEPLHVAFWRFTMAAAMFWLIIHTRRAPAARLPRGRVLAAGLLVALAGITGFYGLSYLPASIYIMLFYTYPAMVALLGLLLGERLPVQGWFALALTLIGVMLTVPNQGAGLEGGNLLGVGFAIANAIVVALYFIASSRLLRGEGGALNGSAWTMTGAWLLTTAIVAATGLRTPAEPAGWLWLAGLALFSTVLPYLALNAGIQRLGASRAAIISTLEPPLTTVLSVWLLGDSVNAVQILGGALIVTSIVLLQVRSQPTQEQAPQT